MEARRILIKLGGGLITNKNKLCEVDEKSLERCAEVISQLVNQGFHPVIVHGAGGFGHLVAKEYRLAEGKIEGFKGQKDAILQIRKDMLQLNRLVCSSLIDRGLKVSSHPAHVWASGAGPDFSGILVGNDNLIQITFGDLVDCPAPKEFGILSGDHLMERLSLLEGVELVAFLVKGVDGILTHLPINNEKPELLDQWNINMVFDGHHQSKVDVTGGIGLKAACGARIADSGIPVWIINGDKPQRLLELAQTGKTIGTQIIAAQSV
ncbi:isopentenyl phosphate kinase [Deltaproteobacteria bacterium]|nr:isopentenyl phosphate kinase [Deltaproteobacteria bacterium]